MSRNRTTLISLTLCGIVALAATAPATNRGGDASEVSTLAATNPVPFEPDPGPPMTDFDAAIDEGRQRRDAEIAAYIAAVEQAEAERLAAEQAAAEEAARVEAERRAAAAREAERQAAAAATPPPPVQDKPVAGPCGGWYDLIAAYFGSETGVACRVMMCESGGDPTIHNNSSTASGLWQFLDGTWESTTGTPGPAANYSAEAQTAAAKKLRDRSGWSQWSCY